METAVSTEQNSVQAVDSVDALAPDLALLRRLGFTLAQMRNFVEFSVGANPSESKLSRLLSRSETEMFRVTPTRSLVEFLETNKPTRKAALIDLYIDEILTMRKYGITIDVICKRLKDDRGIEISPGTLTRQLMAYNPAEKLAPTPDGKKSRRSRRKMTAEERAREAEEIERMRLAREQVERALTGSTPPVFTTPLTGGFIQSRAPQSSINETVNHEFVKSTAPQHGSVVSSKSRGTTPGVDETANDGAPLATNGSVKNGSRSGAAGSGGGVVKAPAARKPISLSDIQINETAVDHKEAVPVNAGLRDLIKDLKTNERSVTQKYLNIFAYF